jgi:ankyrin repeat protein
MRRALVPTDFSTGGRPHPDVLREVARLGGVIDEQFEPADWREDTPVGERLIPAPVQAVLSVKWPAGHTLITGEDEDGYEDGDRVTFPQLVDGDPIAEDRACFVIAFNESTQFFWVIDLDDERPDDPMVDEIDHDVAPDEKEYLFNDPQRLSRMLAGLVVAQPPPEALFPRACAHGDLGAVREALRAGAPVGAVDDSGLTPLHLAAISRSAEVVQVLVDGGADPHAAITQKGVIGRDYIHPDWHYTGWKVPGATPLHYAVDSRGPRLKSMPRVVAGVVRVLLAAGADPAARNKDRRTPLHVAAFGGSTEPVRAGSDQVSVVRMLLDAGCDPDDEDGFGNTPLMDAASQPELVRVLLEAGADPARPTGSTLWDTSGLSALHYAALVHLEESLRLMLSKVTDPDTRTAHGLTPLHCAVRRGHVGPVEALVQAGADVNARLDDPHQLKPGLQSHTPLSLARELGHHHLAALLTDLGAIDDGTPEADPSKRTP